MASSSSVASTRFAAEGVLSARAARGGAEPARGLRLTPVRGRRRGIRCCAVGNPGAGGGVGGAGGGAAAREEFVGFFREAWPYIRGHRGSTFVVVISSEVVSGPHFDGILQDISLLHGLGIQFVLVPGTHVQIDKLLSERGRMPRYVGQYRVTDSDSLEAAMEAAGRIRLTIEAKLSPGPPMLNLRRHGVIGRWHGLVDNVASGNFLGAKRRGVVSGIDYGFTGEVKKIDVSRIKERLDSDSIVVVSNMGYSSSGEVLNCNTYEVATACALAIEADKLICIVDGQIFDEHGRVIHFMSLEEADMLIRKRAKQSDIAANYVKVVDEEGISHLHEDDKPSLNGSSPLGAFAASFHNGLGFNNGNGIYSGEQGFAIGGEERLSRSNDYLSELAAAAFVCHGGVQRVHIIDGTVDGSLLLELFTRDGTGTMIARDVYEGTRIAREEDLLGIRKILRPLEESGVLVKRTDKELLEALEAFYVVERDGSIIACAALFPFPEDKSGEVAAIAVSEECRGRGQGDKLLDYIEKAAMSLGLEKLFLLTTRTADWFVRRGFSECSIESIPEQRRKHINLSRGSKYYIKQLQPKHASVTPNNIIAR
ncbi:probable amino-acid acetyltransferase NAGS2, chloroplastic isoform X2 [Oryza brachyantha]|uniref:probable amino-acid acetyltransferase NAGS2, chloroplastic isoform X2 n=1 Tax=Oryza brachyantha TaxID=4533 RepID=UPI001ADBA9C3|nr:probable amino-acid acetyltransferase NAGS2, chloroplastic isoform X2 [Oryza brachyantha]